MTKVKPGIITTEFWPALLKVVVGLLIGLGVVDPVTGTAAGWPDVLDQVAGLLTAAYGGGSYVKGRSMVKAAAGGGGA